MGNGLPVVTSSSLPTIFRSPKAHSSRHCLSMDFASFTDLHCRSNSMARSSRKSSFPKLFSPARVEGRRSYGEHRCDAHWRPEKIAFGPASAAFAGEFRSGRSSVGISATIPRIGRLVCIELQRAPLSTFERGLKRSIDVFGTVTGLILLLPLFAITAVCIKLDSPGPIFFRQKRRGFNGRPFDIFKFRTMSVLEDGSVINQATQFDDRVTRLGKRLRRASIDELPQLLNILNGSMSLVGPRPHAVAHDNHFDKIVGNYAFRHHVKPGLTGWAQVNGHRGATPTAAEIRHRVEFDLWYIDHWSLRLDIFIIFRTFLEVMRGRNAY